MPLVNKTLLSSIRNLKNEVAQDLIEAMTPRAPLRLKAMLDARLSSRFGRPGAKDVEKKMRVLFLMADPWIQTLQGKALVHLKQRRAGAGMAYCVIQ